MTDQAPPTPPIARKDHRETVLHGVTLSDDYAWLRDKDNPEVTAYLNAENAYAESITADLAPLRDQLYNEMLSHIKQTDESVPYREGDWWYYIRTEEGKQYSIFCRKRASNINLGTPSTLGAPSLTAPSSQSRVGNHSPHPTPDTPEQTILDNPLPHVPLGTWETSELQSSTVNEEQIILDGNQLAEGQAFFAIGATDISDDGRWLAYTTDTTGFRQYTLHIKDLETGETLPGEVERVGSVTWAADNRTLFYSVEDEEQKRQFQLCPPHARAPHATDVLVYQDDDERFNIGAGRTRDGKFIILESASHTTTECRILPADQPTGAFTLISPARRRARILRRSSQRPVVHPHQRSRPQLPPRHRARRCHPGRENWTERIPTATTSCLKTSISSPTSLSPANAKTACPACASGSFRTKAPQPSAAGEIAFPEPAYSAHPHINRIFETTTSATATSRSSRPAPSSSTTSHTGASTLLKQLEVPGGFDRTLYASERIHATAPDGVQVPVSLVYRKDKREPGKNPLYVYGYGSYGYSLPLGFNSNRLSLLDRGVVMAYAHIRGGGDLGKPWHDAGKMLVKRNTFTDFIAVTSST